MNPHEDVFREENQGTIIVAVAPRSALSSPKKSRRKGAPKKNKTKFEGQYNQAHEDSFQGGSEGREESYVKELERNSEGKMRGADEQTMGEVEPGGLTTPYEFLTQRAPSILSIFIPRFTWRSITFWLSILYATMFLVLIGFNYSKTQTDLTWNCSLFQLQNKYFPKLRHSYQIWRVFVSALFHSNIAHFCLDLFALQLYGYFVQWYYGRPKYIVAILLAALLGHFLSAVIQKTSISTTPSAALFAIIGLKIVFLWEYRNYNKLRERRSFLYLLLVLIVGINLIPIFVVNNVDFSTHLGGLIVGLGLGMSFLLAKEEEPTRMQRALRFGSLVLLGVLLVVLVALTFTEDNQEYQLLSEHIDEKCSSN